MNVVSPDTVIVESSFTDDFFYNTQEYFAKLEKDINDSACNQPVIYEIMSILLQCVRDNKYMSFVYF